MTHDYTDGVHYPRFRALQDLLREDGSLSPSPKEAFHAVTRFVDLLDTFPRGTCFNSALVYMLVATLWEANTRNICLEAATTSALPIPPRVNNPQYLLSDFRASQQDTVELCRRVIGSGSQLGLAGKWGAAVEKAIHSGTRTLHPCPHTGNLTIPTLPLSEIIPWEKRTAPINRRNAA